MYVIKGYSAGILIFSEDVQETELQTFLDDKKNQLKRRELTIAFGMGIIQTVNEIVVDVYDKASGKYRPELATSFKN